MNRMSEYATEFVRLKHCGEVLIDISETMMEMFAQMGETLEVKLEFKMVGNTKKKPKVKEISFEEIKTTVVNTISGLDLARYINLLVETAVNTVVSDVARRTMEIIIERFAYETANQVVILTAYGLVLIGIFLKRTKRRFRDGSA